MVELERTAGPVDLGLQRDPELVRLGRRRQLPPLARGDRPAREDRVAEPCITARRSRRGVRRGGSRAPRRARLPGPDRRRRPRPPGARRRRRSMRRSVAAIAGCALLPRPEAPPEVPRQDPEAGVDELADLPVQHGGDHGSPSLGRVGGGSADRRSRSSSLRGRPGRTVIDYAALDSAVGQNWYDLDPDLQAAGPARLPARGPRRGPTARCTRFGALVGGRVARNADIIDANPPRARALRPLGQRGRTRSSTTRPPSTRSGRCGRAGYVVGLRRRRGRAGPARRPASCSAATSYLLSQADTGLVCSLGMTSGVAGLVDAYAPPDVRDRLLAGLRADDARRRAPTGRCSSPSATAAPTSGAPCTAPPATSATVACSSTARSGSARTSTAPPS